MDQTRVSRSTPSETLEILGQPLLINHKFSPIQAVSFDVGGTLIDPWPSVGHVYARAASHRFNKILDPESVTQRFMDAWRSKGEFRYAKSDWAQLVSRTFDELVPDPSDETLFESIYQVFAQPGAWVVYADVYPMLEWLHQRKIPLAVISNWDERLVPLLDRLGLAPYFKVIVVSGATDWQKPDEEIFRYCAEQLELPCTSLLHIGDSPREDIEGARKAGCQAIQIHRSGKPTEREDILTSLFELKHWIQSHAGKSGTKDNPAHSTGIKDFGEWFEGPPGCGVR